MQRNELKIGVVLSYVNMAINFIIPLFYTPIMLRLMGQEEYGLFNLTQSVIGYLGLLTFGMSTSIARYLMKYHTEGNRAMFQQTAGLFQMIYTGIAVVAMAIGCLITLFTGSLFAQGLKAHEIPRMNVLIIIMSVGTAISFIGSVYTTIIFCYERHVFPRVTGIVMTILTPGINLLVLYLGYASIGLAVINVSLTLASNILNAWYCSKKIGIMPKFTNMPTKILREVIPFSCFVFISMIADMLFWAIDKVFIGALMGTTSVAVYNIGVTFQSMMQNMNGAIGGVFTPRVNRIVFSGQPISENTALMIRVGRLQYLILSLFLSGFVVFGRPFIKLWAGEGYEASYAVALLTMFPMTIPLIQNIAFQTITALNKHQFRSIMYLCMAVANAAATYIVIPFLGVTGAALCTCVVVVLGNGLILNWYYYKKIGLNMLAFWSNILRMSIVPAVLAAVCLLFLPQVLSPWHLLFGAAAYTCVYIVLSWFFTMNRYEKDLVLGVITKFLPKKKAIG